MNIDNELVEFLKPLFGDMAQATIEDGISQTPVLIGPRSTSP